jgi:hypothetical protein
MPLTHTLVVSIACYCYARFMKRFTGHKEPWGEFVDVKINAPDLLGQEVNRKKKGRVWISGVCDPYQPLEAKYRLTTKCLEILIKNNWPIAVQTRSPLVLRDIDTICPFFSGLNAYRKGNSIVAIQSPSPNGLQYPIPQCGEHRLYLQSAAVLIVLFLFLFAQFMV